MLEFLQKLLLGDLVGAQHLFGGPFRTQRGSETPRWPCWVRGGLVVVRRRTGGAGPFTCFKAALVADEREIYICLSRAACVDARHLLARLTLFPCAGSHVPTDP